MKKRSVRALVLISAALSLGWGTPGSAANAPTIQPSAARQIEALTSIKKSLTPTQKKIGSRLYMGILRRRGAPGTDAFPNMRWVQPDANGKILVDVDTVSSATKPVVEALEAAGAEVGHVSSRYRTIRARVPMEAIEGLAALPDVRKILLARVAMTQRAFPQRSKETEERAAIAKESARNVQRKETVTRALKAAKAQQLQAVRNGKNPNIVNVSEGDATHRALEARNAFGVDGTGVKICVLSDGVDSLATAVASGDLPAGVDVLDAGSGDEGTAMLEIVHDIAPGAALGFATATTSEASFAQNILDLRNLRGCNIIVDDIIYLDESPFQDGPVAQAVNQVTTSGALYFSSAGNENNKNDTTSGTWEGFFNGNGNLDSLLGAGAGTTHNFGDGGQSLLVEVASGDPPLLIWNDPYGTSANDYDLYDCDGGLTTVFDFSFDTQDGDDDPIEFISGGTFSGERLVVTQFAGADRMLNLIVFRGEVDGTLSTSAATRGHSAAVDAFSVAAAPAAAAFGPGEPTGPFPGPFTAAQLAETFSSDGLRRVYYDFGGNFLGTPGDVSPTGGVVRQKPDITAADGVATSAPGFNPFYGTSAAAPHAAAIAALVKQAFPAFTNAQIRTALQNSAIDIELPGVDRDTGYGIVMAYNTLVANGAPLVANLALGTVTPAQLAGDGDAYIEPNEDWNLTINLQNVGAVGATAISATLSTSTPGVAVFARPSEGHRAASPVAVNASTATYPNIGVGGNANNSVPFSFTDLSVGCGQRINFTLTVTYTGGLQPQQSFNFSLLTGSPGAPVTISYTGPAVFIPDGTGLTGTMPGAPVNASLLVAGVGPLYDVDFRFDGATCSTTIGSTTVGLDHTFVHDLDIVLRSPATTTVLMIDNTDGSGNNFCQTYLDDESAGASIQTVVSANAPFTGSFKPANFLSAFDGQNADGTWQLQAQDFFGGDTGNIRAWSLILTPAVCNAPALTSAVTATKAVTGGTLLAGGTVVYTVTLTNTGTGSVIDNAGNEFTDTLPPSLTLVTATASSGTATMAGNVVNWNGGIPPAGVVTITITANINGGAGLPISNQGTVSFDANRDGVNGDGSAMTNDPATAAPNDPTVFTPLGLVAVPALSTIGLAILAAALALVAVTVLRLRLTR